MGHSSQSEIRSSGRVSRLVLVAAVVALVSGGTYLAGVALPSALVRLAGFMVGASTFVPMPADTYVLAVAASENAVWVAGVAGAVNAAVVIVEAWWIREAASFPRFSTLQEFVGTNPLLVRFRRFFFGGLVLAGFSPLPFEPFRFLAAMSDYPRWRYALATFLGRGGRYYCIALAGSAFADLGILKIVLVVTLAVFFVGLFRSYRSFARSSGN